MAFVGFFKEGSLRFLEIAQTVFPGTAKPNRLIQSNQRLSVAKLYLNFLLSHPASIRLRNICPVKFDGTSLQIAPIGVQ